MFVNTPRGARSVYWGGPHPSKDGGELRFPQKEDVVVSEKGETKVKKTSAPDTCVCESCREVTLSKHIRATPKRGFVCLKCIVRLEGKCYI